MAAARLSHASSQALHSHSQQGRRAYTHTHTPSHVCVPRVCAHDAYKAFYAIKAKKRNFLRDQKSLLT